MEHVCPGVQGGGAVEHNEAELAVFEAGAAVDEEYVEKRFEEFIHGEAYLDEPSLCGVYDGAYPRWF